MITVSDQAGIAVVTLDRGKVNALDLDLLRAISSTFGSLGDAKGVVLTGAGRAFSAGVDLRRLGDGGASYVGEFVPALRDALLDIFDCPRPVVAAINGHAIAGGCLLAMACDARLMASGTIGLTELLVGLPFPGAAFEIAQWAAGPAVSTLIMTGRTLAPYEALDMGLVQQVVAAEALLGASLALAEQLAQIPQQAYATTKSQLHGATRRRIRELDPDDAEVLALWQSPAALDRIRRYLDALTAS